jgi:hypothetical protein
MIAGIVYAGQMKAFVNDAVGLHLLGRYPYPNGAVWARQRLEYYVKKIRSKMLEEQRRPKQRRPAEGSPSDTDVTEGFGVGTGADNALNMEIFDTEPLSRRPQLPKIRRRRRRRIRSAAAPVERPRRFRAT